jgi:hypothetical protein
VDDDCEKEKRILLKKNFLTVLFVICKKMLLTLYPKLCCIMNLVCSNNLSVNQAISYFDITIVRFGTIFAEREREKERERR